MMKLASLILFIGVACQPPCYPEIHYSNFTNYPTPAEGLTPEDADLLSRVAACLAPLRQHWLSSEEAQAAECLPRENAVLEVRSCLRVAVAPDWSYGSCGGMEQVFPCQIGPERCLEKGLHPTLACPCMCRAQIQDETTIWITPNRKLLAAYAVTMLTGCLSPWTSTLAPCSNLPP